MLYSFINSLDKLLKFKSAAAHCDIPCKIYDPSTAQIAALSVIRFIDIINELEQPLSVANTAQLARLVREKEIHASKVKEEVRVIWGDYFKQPQFDQFPDTHALVHSIMLTASKCKQHIEREHAEQLLALVNQFADSFWQTKGIATYQAKSPYPPSEHVVYPDLKSA
ncbi:superoxide dismutase [Ni] [Pseudoalteromonas sp. MM1]|uniref:superoxide dismutase, Ni n=1 Tax=Pseudoalteromonas sp. MM1 TaxID=3036714 RepID=UPI002573BC51|nr:superoxide dismutase, Ni [Pseudoalteromonas sp. MM1]BED91399.1 superoxide dismutase [Ni] [Pseudoalteromonas sp. MM1]